MDTPQAKAEEHFETDRAKHTSRTREVFERLFANLFRENDGAQAVLSSLLLAPEPELAALAELLPKFGFAHSESSARASCWTWAPSA